MPRHPRSRELAALADGAASLALACRLALHLARCPACRRRVRAFRDDRRAVSSALAELGQVESPHEAWARITALLGPMPDPAPPRAWVLILAIPALVLALVRPASQATELISLAHELGTRPPGEAARPAREGTPDVRFVDAVSQLRREGRAWVVRDECCADHDAEGPADDGLLALQVRRPATRLLVVYDDVDRSRSLTRGDLVRWVSLTPDGSRDRPGPLELSLLPHDLVWPAPGGATSPHP